MFARRNHSALSVQSVSIALQRAACCQRCDRCTLRTASGRLRSSYSMPAHLSRSSAMRPRCSIIIVTHRDRGPARRGDSWALLARSVARGAWSRDSFVARSIIAVRPSGPGSADRPTVNTPRYSMQCSSMCGIALHSPAELFRAIPSYSARGPLCGIATE